MLPGIDKAEVLEALTLTPRESAHAKVKRGQAESMWDHDAKNTIPVHVPDNFGADSEIVFFLDGKDIGSLSAIKLARLLVKLNNIAYGE